MLRRVSVSMAATGLAMAGVGATPLGAGAESGSALCGFNGAGAVAPPVNYQEHPTTYRFTGSLTCGSSDSTLSSGTVTALGAGSIGCFRGDHNAVLQVAWNNGRSSTLTVHFSDVLAGGHPAGLLLAGGAELRPGGDHRRPALRQLPDRRLSLSRSGDPRRRSAPGDNGALTSRQKGKGMHSVGRTVPRATAGMRVEVAPLAVTVTGVFLLTIAGAVHFDRAELVRRAVPYLAVLFYLNAAGTLAAVVGIALRIRGAWTLGLLVAAPSAVLYLIAGTRGLPEVHLRTLTSPGGMLCLAAEILYTALWVRVARRDLGV
jgi:hypothetical protein